MTMNDGERQVAPTLEGIRRDHRARYEFAARTLPPKSRVIDFACGIGYGARILADAGHRVRGYDLEQDAIDFGREHYPHSRVSLARADARKPGKLREADAALCFETIEHVEDPRPLLRALRAAAPTLIASVPNEDAFPYAGQLYHFRHYTKAEFEELLAECGWRVSAWHGQEGAESDVERAPAGRTLIAVARHAAPAKLPAPTSAEAPKKPPPRHVAILGLGPSVNQFLEITKRKGGRSRFCDEVWTINALGDVIDSDMVFHMDDVRIQEIRAEASPDSNIAAMLAWMRRHPGPIMTSRAHRGYPGLVEYPLEAVINSTKHPYMNSTAAYAVAYAVHLGVKRLSLFGMDFTYPNAHQAERGRACVEFWLGIATARGIEITIPRTSSLMDGVYPVHEKLYGYDAVMPKIAYDSARRARVRFEPRETLPTAEEIEARYDHSRHPNPIAEGQP